MIRRTFLATTLALMAAPFAAPMAASAGSLDYRPGLVKDRLAAGETVFLDFKASWCTTCAAQERVIRALKKDNPAYEEHVTFIDVDWDEYGSHVFTRELKIPRRSTLVVLKADQELGRIVAQTSKGQIKALMDTALKAGM